jgi:outer membrane biosynthesis protein TonB
MWAVQTMTGALRWRWTPAIGLSIGALLYAIVVALVVPPKFGGGVGNALVVTSDDEVQPSVLTNTMRAPPAPPSRPMERARPAFVAQPPQPTFSPPPLPPPAPEPEIAPPPLPHDDPPPPPPPEQVQEEQEEEEESDEAAAEAGRAPPPPGVVTPRGLAAPLRMLKLPRQNETPGSPSLD